MASVYVYIYIYLSTWIWSALLAFTTRQSFSIFFISILFLSSSSSSFFFFLCSLASPQRTAVGLLQQLLLELYWAFNARRFHLYSEDGWFIWENLGEKGDTKGKTDKRRKWDRAEKVFSPLSLSFSYTRPACSIVTLYVGWSWWGGW